MSGWSRRKFLARSGGVSVGLTVLGYPLLHVGCHAKRKKKMPVTIDIVDSDFEREPLVRPFGFKDGCILEPSDHYEQLFARRLKSNN